MRRMVRIGLLAAGIVATVSALFAFQRPFRVYISLEPYDNVELPSDYKVPAEFVFARLMYPPHPRARFSRPFGFGGRSDWREGGSSWAQDYPRADRQFSLALNRLTRVHARSVEQPVNLEDGDDVYNWPWMNAGEMGDWTLTNEMAGKLRDYLLHGGFLMLDDFWGTVEWDRFEEGMKKVFPDREIVEIANDDPIFHSVYDLDDRYQIPGQWALRGGTTYRDRKSVV